MTVPVATPKAEPVALLIEAIVLLLLTQLPPVEVLVKVAEVPVQIVEGPESVPAEVGAPTFTTKEAVSAPQELAAIYLMVSRPAESPPTTPVESTVAWVLVALHVPPVPVVVSVMPEPTHTLPGPVMVPASGSGFTVILVVAATVPQPVVTE